MTRSISSETRTRRSEAGELRLIPSKVLFMITVINIDVE